MVIGFFVSSCDDGKRTTTQIIEKPTISLLVWDETAIELPDVQFLLPGSIGQESSRGNVEVTLSKAASIDVKIDYTVSGILTQISAEDYKVSSGIFCYTSRKYKENFDTHYN